MATVAEELTGLVAPHAGAWIETQVCGATLMADEVAPHAGAWIETQPGLRASGSLRSPPTRGRGLKLNGHALFRRDGRRPPRGGVD